MANVSKATFIDQGIEFPLWATEETLQAVRASLDKDFRADRSDGRIQTQAQQKTTQAISKQSAILTSYNLRLIRTFGKMDGSFKSLKDAILASSKGSGAPGQAIATSLGMLDEYVKVVRQLSDVGAGLNTRYADLVSSSATAFMFINDFADVIGENGMAIRNLGDSATDGFTKFAGLSRQLQENTRQFGMFGMEQEELNEMLLNRIEVERQSGATGLDVTQRTAKAMEALIDETSGMAEITGRSRREAMREAQAATNRVDVSTYLRQVRRREGDEAADVERGMIERLVAQMEQQFGKEMGKTLSDDFIKAYVTGGGLAVAEELQKLAGVTDASKIENLIRALGTRDKEQLGGAINELGLEMERTADKVDPIMLSLNEGFNMAATAAADFRQMSTEELRIARKNQKEELKENSKDLVLSMENYQRQIMANLSSAKNSILIAGADMSIVLLSSINSLMSNIPSGFFEKLPGWSDFIASAIEKFAGAGQYDPNRGRPELGQFSVPAAYTLPPQLGGTQRPDIEQGTATAPDPLAQQPDIWGGALGTIGTGLNNLVKEIHQLKEFLKNIDF
jgi:hypothetical protein